MCHKGGGSDKLSMLSLGANANCKSIQLFMEFGHNVDLKRQIWCLSPSMLLARLLIVSIGVVGVILAGCGSTIFSNSELEFGGTCNVASDQMDSFMAPVKTFPLRAILDKSFTADERRAISDSADQWNALGRQIAGHDFFRVTVGDIPSNISTVDPKDCGQSFSDSSSFYIVRITDMSRWTELGFSKIIPGATIRCAGGYDFSHQIVLMNPGTEDQRLIDSSQFASVIVHEFGHALGLDHSCIDAQGKPSYRSCKGLPETHAYRTAIMFPRLSRMVYSSALSASAPELKEIPMENDFTRTQCLYSPK